MTKLTKQSNRKNITTIQKVSGIAVGLSSTLTALAESKEKIEMYLSFGATRWEASRPVFVDSIRLALLPTINSMSIMGLVSIPGMMTGQILGGAKIEDAVRYQQVRFFNFYFIHLILYNAWFRLLCSW
jgi:ABC-type iron transport system FetAB permease component